MIVADIIKMIQAGTLPTVKFKPEIEHYEGYFDANMIAQIVSYSELPGDVQVVLLSCYVKDHDEHNSLVEKHNYYDANGIPQLSAREANLHPERHGWKEDVYVDRESEIPFELYNPSSIEWKVK